MKYIKNKIILIFIFLLFVTLTSYAQIVNIPDSNFKKVLIKKGIDKNKDGEIEINEAKYVDSLEIGWQSISDLTGIEAFISLKYLFCGGNNLVSIDLSNNKALMELYCYNNRLSLINVKNNQNLLALYCSNNELKEIDVSGCTYLQVFVCYKNQLTTLHLEKKYYLRVLNFDNNYIPSINLTESSSLTSLSCSQNKLVSIDISKNGNLQELICFNNPLLLKICISKLQLELMTNKPSMLKLKKDETVLISTDCE